MASLLRLAMLVLGHRGKLEKIRALPEEDLGWLPLFALRIASIFNRSRFGGAGPRVRVRRLHDRGFVLETSREWLSRNPMTAAALRDEVAAWAAIGWELRQKPFVEHAEAKANSLK